MALPVQEFQIGQRVRKGSEPPFVIRTMFWGWDEVLRYGSIFGNISFEANELTLCSERPPNVPSERLVLSREPEHRFNGQFPHNYRCETDDEMAARHTVEQAEYDAQWGGK